MDRDASLGRLRERGEPWDVLVIGGGATGLGVAVDAAARGHSVGLVERGDFGCGTSSRSTKLVHGGVRYLQQGNLSLVREALFERTILLANAPHLAHPRAFVIPCHAWWERAFYRTGLKLYDILAAGSGGVQGVGMPGSRALARDDVLARVPGLAGSLDGRRLRGGVLYHDGQFDDARLAVNLAQSAHALGACVVNHVDATEILTHDGRVSGAMVRDAETGESFECRARGVINATGPFCDAVRRLDDPDAVPVIAPSQGVHLVLPSRFLAGETALIVPKTPDGRVIFAIPWRDRVVVGTTDTAIDAATPEPRPRSTEVDFLLELCGRYLAARPARSDVLALFTGIRPLVASEKRTKTKSLPRDHAMFVSSTGMLTITGGKWTTYRRMAEDAVDRIEPLAGLPGRPCTTQSLRVHGSPSSRDVWFSPNDPLAVYGTDATAILRIADETPHLAGPIHPALPTTAAQVAWAVRQEMARTVDDVLSRRTRDLVIDARAAVEAAPVVAAIMAAELGRDEAWQRAQIVAFNAVAAACLPSVA